MTDFIDPRARMRDALRLLLQQQPPEWDDASLMRFRNLLLDQTGSDARPLADLLLEAVRRGWRDHLPRERMEPARWDALSSPFVMRWSAERFVQQEMARWAAESWGFALDVIGPEQLRIAVPPPVTPSVTRTPTRAAPVIKSAVPGRPTIAPVKHPVVSRAVASGTPARAAAIGRLSAARATQRPTNVPYRPAQLPARSRIAPLNPRFVRTLVGLAVGSYLFFVGRMAFAIRENRRSGVATGAPIVTTASRDSVSVAAETSAVPVPPTVGVRSLTDSASLSPSSARVVQTPEPLQSSGAQSPGVPSITRNALPGATSDSSRMLLVEPAKRAAGASLPAAAAALMPSRTDPQPYDEVQLTDGTRMTGRVDIVRAGTIIFRDMRTGLRNEINKDNIEQIITEFGTSVRFHEPTLAANAPAPSAKAPSTKKDLAASSRATGVRSTGVAGRYRIRYAQATANGSPECTSVWKRAPQTEDIATVTHVPGADTLVIAFDGGDNFPSNVDKDGYFASTPRIMPDQARTSTALVTRLSGRFPTSNSLSLTVSIVFYRRMRVGADLACTVYVNANGARER